MPAKDFETIALAAYAAIVATASLLWNVRIAQRDVANLKLVGCLCFKRTTVLENKNATPPTTTTTTTTVLQYLSGGVPDLPRDKPLYFAVVATNIGRRTIVISGWSVVTLKNNVRAMQTTTGLNPVRTLAESESTTLEMEEFDRFRGKAVSVAIIDSHGKNWYLAEHEFQTLKDTMLEYKL